jgi:transposase
MFLFNKKSKIISFPKPINFHKGIDALAHIVQTEIKVDLAPNLFVLFCNRCKNKIKILYHDGTHLLLFYTRLEKTLKFKYLDQEGVIFNSISFDKFINTTHSRRRSNKFKIAQKK